MPNRFCLFFLILVTFSILIGFKFSFVDQRNRQNFKRVSNTNICDSSCKIQLVESIPEGLVYPDGSPLFMSTFDAWNILIQSATKTINISSYYWKLLGLARTVQSSLEKRSANFDTQILVKKNAAEVRSVDFNRLFGAGVLHTKLWIIDGQHMYIGSANMDWRALTQKNELGALVTNCSCLVEDVSKIFNVYWDMGRDKAEIPLTWPEEYQTRINSTNPILVNFNGSYKSNVFFASSPQPMSPKGRTQEIDAIVDVIKKAKKFIHISVKQYLPMIVYTTKMKYWSLIDDALRTAAIDNLVSVKLLISWWDYSRPVEDHFLHSLQDLSHAYRGVDIQVRRFIVPTTNNQAKVPFSPVSHNKYMVTDQVAFIQTSNLVGDYFINTAGIGFVLEDSSNGANGNASTIRSDLASVFNRDWNSPYAVKLRKLGEDPVSYYVNGT